MKQQEREKEENDANDVPKVGRRPEGRTEAEIYEADYVAMRRTRVKGGRY